MATLIEPILIGLICIFALLVALGFFLAYRVQRRYINGGTVRLKKTFNALLGVFAIILIVFSLVLNYLGSSLGVVFDLVLAKTPERDTSVSTTEDDWRNLARRIGDEGMVLMRNENHALPLLNNGAGAAVKVNLLGYYAYNPYYSGGGSGSVSADDSIDVVTSLKNAGIEINNAVLDEGVYDIKKAKTAGIGFSTSTLSNEEVPVSVYKGKASFESMKQYSNVAIMVIGRTGSEGKDLTTYGEVSGYNYLQLNDNERAIMKQARNTFAKLIVIINSANAMETGFLDEYDVDACIWAGLPGPYGFSSLGKILNGTVNPSAKLPDTWTTDNDSAPAGENYGDQEASNRVGSHYVDYVEGIYVGYKWYETAYAEKAVVTNTKTNETFDYGKDYDSIVSFPFGTGLSYTTFSQRITSISAEALDPKGSISVGVEVTNTGDVAGKEVVQLYMSAPYTDYDKKNGVEKAAVQLIGYDKTDELAPGASQKLTIEVPVEDLAAYDTSHSNDDGTVGSYMLDAGEYTFSIRSNAHESLGEKTASLDDQFFYSGDNQRSSDIQQAHNQFEDAARGTYLSRQNGFANYADAMESVSSEIKSTVFEDEPDSYDSSYDSDVTKSLKKGKDYEARGDLTLADMKGASYDDERWGQLVSQLTVKELQSLVNGTTYSAPKVNSIDKPFTVDSDGPMGISSMYNVQFNGVAYPCIPLLAATFNTDLATEFGHQIADQAKNRGISGLYAPAMDIHRWAFSGRNFEYYSEDGVLSAITASNQVRASRENGLVVYIKHFALNDQDTNRGMNLHTYSNEGAADIFLEIITQPFLGFDGIVPGSSNQATV
ncbi:glycoside hydrolase family 3 C-terminal domain-containing protein [Bifidobacterium sp. SO4]|nr:glycoside hydrolase family 3 C-terminal domain-containing protein [Bifidobacterium sp. SO4]